MTVAKKCKSNGKGKYEPIHCPFCHRYVGHTPENKDCIVFIFCPKCKNDVVVLGKKQESLTDEELTAMMTW